jgi:GNAT superfamily N-acetyltransferase
VSILDACASALEFRRVSVDDVEASPLLADLLAEYSLRYPAHAHDEMSRYPAQEFAAPHGSFLIVLENGVSVAGGAFRRYGPDTAELKRIWTAASHRRRGLARLVLAELEREAAGRGYTRLYLTTGPRQPEACALYLTSGYVPLFDVDADPETIGALPFEKQLAGWLPGN